MKALLLVVLCAGVSCADQASEAFIAGFARALQARQAQAQQQEAEQPSAYEYRQHQAYPEAGYYGARDNYGNLAYMEFATYSQCMSMVSRSEMYRECVWIGK